MTSSQGPDRKSPPGPVKIHYFEKKPGPRPGGPITLEFEAPVYVRPTLPEFSLQPPPEAAGGHQEAASAEERGSPTRGTPTAPAAPSRPAAPSGLVSERMATAQSLFAQGQLTQARGILEKLVARGVGGAAAYSLLGTIYMAQGSLERALESLDEALARDGEDLSARLHRGEVRLQKGDLLLAQQDLQHVLEIGTAGSPLIEQARRLLLQLEAQRGRRRP